MSNILDDICKLRDLFEDKKNYHKVLYAQNLIKRVFNDVHRHLDRKDKNHAYELEFTSQDLRELAGDIRNFLHSLEDKMNPEKNIKKIWKNSNTEGETREIHIERFVEEATKVMAFRRDMIIKIYELLNLLEFHSVYLYYLELVVKDKIALTCTERIIKDEGD